MITKKTWEVINQLRGKTKRTIKPSFVINNVRINERCTIAQEFNKYFVSIASNMNKSIDDLGVINIASLQTFQEFMPKSIPNSIFLNEYSTFEITQIINELETGKSSDIHIKVIKRANSIISPVLALHFNYLMKIGKITPIYKKEDEEQLENYRPISTLPIFGEIFEKLIYIRLYNFFVAQNLLHDKQFGFRKNHSTSHAINYSIHHINQKLCRYGIQGNCLELLKDYLTSRNQLVKFNGEKI